MIDNIGEEAPGCVGLENQEGQWYDFVQVLKSENQGNGRQEKMGGSAQALRTRPSSPSLFNSGP